jgi:hypothetical protein
MVEHEETEEAEVFRFLDTSCGCEDLGVDGSAGASPYPSVFGRAKLLLSRSFRAIEPTKNVEEP